MKAVDHELMSTSTLTGSYAQGQLRPRGLVSGGGKGRGSLGGS
jgi:hypothetical protein